MVPPAHETLAAALDKGDSEIRVRFEVVITARRPRFRPLRMRRLGSIATTHVAVCGIRIADIAPDEACSDGVHFIVAVNDTRSFEMSITLIYDANTRTGYGYVNE